MKYLIRKTLSLVCVLSLLMTCIICAVAMPTAAAGDGEFDYSGVENEGWLYDFKAMTGTADETPAFMVLNTVNGSTNDLNDMFTGAANTDGNKSYFDKDGLHVFTNYNNGVNSTKNYTDLNGKTSCRRVLLWDYDYAKDIIKSWDATTDKIAQFGIFPNTENDRNLHPSWAGGPDMINRLGFVALDNGLYAVTMKFRVSSMNTATKRIDLNIGVYDDASHAGEYHLSRNGYTLDYVTVSKASDEWLYYTAIVDGNKFKGNGKNTLAIFVSNDAYTADGTYNKIDIESVSVERYYDSINGELGVKFYNAEDYNGTVKNNDAATVNGKNYILASTGSPEASFELPEVVNNDSARVFKMWKTKMDYYPPVYKSLWENGYAGYAGDTYKVTGVNYANIRYMEASYVTDSAPASNEPVIYKWDFEKMYQNKRTLVDGILISGDIGAEDTIGFTLKHTADGLSFRSNGGSGALPDKNEGSASQGAQRITFYTGKGADASKWDGNYLRFKYGYTYKFSMTYKVENIDNYGSFIGLSSIVNDEYGATRWGATRVIKSFSTTTNTNGWVQVTCFFTADEYSAGNIASFAIQTKNGVITVKDATIEESYGDVNGDVSNIYFRDNSTSTPNPFSGFVGDTHGTLPTPAQAGYEFVEWCTDRNLTTKYEGTTFPESDITLYAKWKLVPQAYTFDSINLYGEGHYSSDAYSSVKDGENNVLKYSLTSQDYIDNPDTTEFATYRRMAINDGNKNHYRVTPGVEYTVSVKYKVLSVEEGGTFAFSTSKNMSVWTNFYEQGVHVKYGEPSNEWKTAEVKFYAKVDDKVKDANYLNLCVNGKAVILFDDITITAGEARANYYGNIIRFNVGEGDKLEPICGDEGEAITMPTPKRTGYAFVGWYKDIDLKEKFTDTVFGSTDVTVYAKWALGKYTEGFEKYPEVAKMFNFSSGWIFYDKTATGFDASNVKSGSTSLQRNSTTAGARGFSIMRSDNNQLGTGEQYTVSFYIKPTKVTDKQVLVNLIHMGSVTSTTTPRATENICSFENLKEGEWNKVSFTFTAQAPYIGLSTSGGNEFFIDDITVNLLGYNGVATGENTTGVNIALMVSVIIAMGALVVFGKKVVFVKR